MQLDLILKDLDYKVYMGDITCEVDDISYDSRRIVKGTVFVWLSDRTDYLWEALSKGACAVVVPENSIANIDKRLSKEWQSATVITVDGIRHALAIMSSAFFEHPEKKLKIIGITGTKGKTTTAYMLHTILVTSGIKAGLIGTIETIYNEEWYPVDNTTPESYLIYETFMRMVLSGIKVVIMEVSSQALKMHRVDGIVFDLGIYTNISADHISSREHRNFEEYLECKLRLFNQCRKALVNMDDSYGKQVLMKATCPVKTYAIKNTADYKAYDISLYESDGFERVSYNYSGRRSFVVKLPTPGIFNVYNSLAAICAGEEFSLDPKLICEAVFNTRIKGRLEIVPTRFPFTVVIDYAHNDIALRNLLESLRSITKGRLICCYGCGGNRDKSRRVLMGRVSGKYADITVVTSDNPRFEEPQDIIDEIVKGIKQEYGAYVTIVDRKEAVEYAIKMGRAGDTICFAGKGHEDYQEIAGERIPFNERFVIRDLQAEYQER